MTRLEEIEQHLSKSPYNTVIINKNTYFRNVYNMQNLSSEEINLSGKDIYFHCNNTHLRRFNKEDKETFVYTDHTTSIQQLERAKLALLELKRIITDQPKLKFEFKDA